MKIFDLLEKNLENKKPIKLGKPLTQDIGLALIEQVEPVVVFDNGLSSKEAHEILEKEGKNQLRNKKKIKPAKIFLNQYKDIMTLILLACTGVSVLMGEYVEAISIAVIILMNGILGFLQEYKTEKTLEALKTMASPMARVYRDGVIQKIDASEIVRGDILILKAGDKIPADGRLIEDVSLECDESMLTGESIPVTKASLYKDEQAMLFTGCIITKGHCKIQVTATGMNTKMGSIALMLQDIEEEPTPLQIRLAKLSKYIAVGCLLVCGVVTVTGILRGEPLMQMLITGVSLAVAAVPEGLPAIVTISLALSVSRMVKRNALVRRLHAVETLGCATVICSDKTGTLTQNKMTATKIYTLNGSYAAEKFPVAENDMLMKSITLCNNAVIEANGFFGDHTEICLLNFANLHKTNAKQFNCTRLDEQPFDSTRKRMSVVVKDSNNQKYMFVKGGVDILLPLCSDVLNGAMEQTLSRSIRNQIEQANSNMADNALRVLCVGYKKMSSFSEGKIEDKFTFLGLIGMIDPPRKEVKSSILSCYKAGIKTVMITGDHKNTAVAIAKEIGLYRKNDMVLGGDDLDSMTFDELCEVVNNVTVFARVNPSHKLLIVRAFKRCGHIVAMTGDGVNDAPAIKEADIGVSMGITGTDVTREASEIVLLDDNFATLVNAVDEGRSIYSNIRKFIRYLLACNIGEVITMFLGMLMGMPVILFPIQILLVNLITDGLPAIALGLEPAEENAMSCPPRRPNESVFSDGLAGKIVIRGILIGLSTLATFVMLFSMTGCEDIARSGALFALIFAQLIHVFECKSETQGLFSIKFLSNMKLVGAASLSLIVLIAVIYIPVLQGIFGTVALTLNQTLVPIVFCCIAPLVGAWKKH